MLLGKDDDDWTTKDTQMGERKKSAHLDDDPKKEWRKNVRKKCPSFFFLPVHFFLHFLPSLFGRELEGIVKSTLTHPY